MMKVSEETPYRLESVVWNHPGKALIVITRIVASGGKVSPAAPKVSDFFNASGVNPRLRNVRMEVRDGVQYWYWSYECGFNLSSPTDRQNADLRGEQWSMSVDLMEVPFAQHPDALEISNKHGGSIKGGEIVFSRYVGNKKNPWFGLSGFYFPTVNLEVQCIVSKKTSVSFKQVDEVGTNDAGLLSPNGKASGFSFISNSPSKGRKPWLLTGSTVRQMGEETLETKSWKWGGKVQWLDALYDPDWKGAAKGAAASATGAGIGAR